MGTDENVGKISGESVGKSAGTTVGKAVDKTVKTLRRIVIAAVVIALARAGLNQLGSAVGTHGDALLEAWFEPSQSAPETISAATVESPMVGNAASASAVPRPLFAPPPFLSSSSASPSAPQPFGLLGDRPAAAAVPQGKAVSFTRGKIGSVRFYHTRIDLQDPTNFITVGLANNAQMANSRSHYGGREKFPGLVKRGKGAITVNGTFFSGDARSRVMGNLVAEGQVMKYSRWENYGTTLGIGVVERGNHELAKTAEMVTARTEGRPKWENHWLSITAGPRLVKQGKIWLAPQSEGFRDRRVLTGKAKRSAVGIGKDGRHLHLVTFITPVTLKQEAYLMHALGSRDAMNLDGGSSLGLAHRGKVLLNPPRSLTNVLTVYDRYSPAPQRLRDRWAKFRDGDRPALPGLN
ncbi:MAG: phosphodiester glycosidase family protein [Cyanophyceae cyanobacterium]